MARKRQINILKRNLNENITRAKEYIEETEFDIEMSRDYERMLAEVLQSYRTMLTELEETLEESTENENVLTKYNDVKVDGDNTMMLLKRKRRKHDAVKEERQLQATDKQREMQAAKEKREMQAAKEEREMQAAKEEREMQAAEKEKQLQAAKEERQLQATEKEKQLQAAEKERQLQPAEKEKERIYELQLKKLHIEETTLKTQSDQIIELERLTIRTSPTSNSRT